MRKLTTMPRAAAGKPGKTGGYAEPTPDRERGDDAEDAFDADYEQGRETTRERDDTHTPAPKKPARKSTTSP